MKALIIIDVQNDFMPGGSLAVPNGDRIIPVINALLPRFEIIVATQDWHPPQHKSFAKNHPGKEAFAKIAWHGKEQTLWPEHCVQGTSGAEFHPELITSPIAALFRKGMDAEIDSYSAFYDNHHQRSTGLAGFLREMDANDLYFCGVCADICVYYSIKDALQLGFQCTLVENATCALQDEMYQQLKRELIEQEVRFINT